MRGSDLYTGQGNSNQIICVPTSICSCFMMLGGKQEVIDITPIVLSVDLYN